MADALEAYAAHYAAAQRKRRVKWLPYLGTVDVEVEMNDGRRVRASVTPVEAAVAELVAGMGVPAEALATVKQVHSADVVTLTDAHDIPTVANTEADGIVTARRGVALAVLTADCQPILLADPQAGVIGACHAGWRGALDGIIEATVDAMRALGATQIRAVIGPTISQRAYEVGPDFMDSFLAEDPGYDRFFSGGPNGRPMFDLPSFGLMHLREAGVDAEWSGHCTYSDPDRFFSYRRATHEGQVDYGRLISAITL